MNPLAPVTSDPRHQIIASSGTAVTNFAPQSRAWAELPDHLAP